MKQDFREWSKRRIRGEDTPSWPRWARLLLALIVIAFVARVCWIAVV